MKITNYLILTVMIALLITSCEKEKQWSKDYDINLPVPEVTSASETRVNINDTFIVQGIFNQVTSVTIGGGNAQIKSISNDSTEMVVKALATSNSGYLIVENIYKIKSPEVVNITVEGGGAIEIPNEVEIIDFATKGALPNWTASTWSEVRTAESGYDLNENIAPPAGYEHYYTMSDVNWDQAGGGNAPYGYFNTDNNGAGFDIQYYSEPYVSVLINTGDYVAYLSYSATAGEQTDFNSNQAPGGNFSNMEAGTFLQTHGKWLWYSFKLSDLLGTDAPEKLESSGLLIRNPWAGPDPYPGFQINIAKMVITEGPIQKPLITIFDFSSGKDVDIPSWTPNEWSEVQTFEEQGFDLNMDKGLSLPRGYGHYYAMNDHSVNKVDKINPSGGGNVPYGFFTTTNGGEGFSDAIKDYDDLYFNYLINTGSYAAYADYANVNDDGTFSWVDLRPDFTANGKMANNEGQYNKTDGEWLWYSFSVAKIYGGVVNIPEDLNAVGMFMRNPWAGPDPYPGFELNIAKVVFSNGPIQN